MFDTEDEIRRYIGFDQYKIAEKLAAMIGMEIDEDSTFFLEMADVLMVRKSDRMIDMAHKPQSVKRDIINVQSENHKPEIAPEPEEIYKNKAQCLLCKDIIESKHVHDFVSCKCGEIFVDGGNKYWRAGAKSFDNFLRINEER